MKALGDFAQKIRESEEIVVFTGAGISTESGIPDFRSPGGIWTRYRPVTFQEYVGSETARIEAWKRRLDGWEQYKNVDGLHSQAGLPDGKIVELHGSNRKVICLKWDRSYDPDEIIKRLVGDFESPKCDACGGVLKSATVSFGQAMPEEPMRVAQEWTEQAEVFIVMGSSLQVQPAASFPVLAKRNGALLAIINREPGPLDEIADFVHHGGIGEFCGRFGEMIADG
jgi:NAD-dependent deacetylase